MAALPFYNTLAKTAECYQSHDTILSQTPIRMFGTLSNKVKIQSLLPADLSLAEIQYITGNKTGTPFYVIGSNITQTNFGNQSKLTGFSIFKNREWVSASKSNSSTLVIVSSWTDSGRNLSTQCKTNICNIACNSTLLIVIKEREVGGKLKLVGRVRGIWFGVRDVTVKRGRIIGTE